MAEKIEHLEIARKTLAGYLVSIGYTKGMASLMVNGLRKPSLERAAEIEREFGIPASAWATRVPLQETWDFIVKRAS